MTDVPTLHTHQVSRTDRYATLGTPAHADEWWVVLHGYGQLAPDFIRAFTPIATPERCIVAPEGLSRFYLDGMDEHEEVGASWMTREAREDEIRDYVAALDATIDHLAGAEAPPPIHVLGFSQGAATASRWTLLRDPPVNRLVLWAGSPAHDLDLGTHADRLRAMDLTIVVGEEDPYVTEERREAVLRRLEAHDISVLLHTFEGGHRLDRSMLQTLASP